MTDNPNENALTIPDLPDFDKLQNTVRFITAQGFEIAQENANLLDFTPTRGDNLLPVVRAGQVEEIKGSETVKDGKKNVTTYPLEKSLFLEVPEYGESEESDKPTLHMTFSKLPANKMFFIPVGFDQQRRYWQNDYNPENAAEPDCQSNRYLVMPIPDEKFLKRNESGKIDSGKFSHACVTLNASLRTEPFCPAAKWLEDGKPACVHYALIYGLLYLPEQFDPMLVVTQYKRGSIDSGLQAQQNLNRLVRQNLPIYSYPYTLSHTKPNPLKAGYSYFITGAKQDGKLVPTDTYFPGFTDQYGDLLQESTERVHSIIQASRDYGAMKPVVSLVNGNGDSVLPAPDGVDTPF